MRSKTMEKSNCHHVCLYQIRKVTRVYTPCILSAAHTLCNKNNNKKQFQLVNRPGQFRSRQKRPSGFIQSTDRSAVYVFFCRHSTRLKGCRPLSRNISRVIATDRVLLCSLSLPANEPGIFGKKEWTYRESTPRHSVHFKNDKTRGRPKLGPATHYTGVRGWGAP